MAQPRRSSLLFVMASAVLAACQSAAGPQPAVLESADAEYIATLKTAAASALGKARVEFGPGDLTASPQIAVLPPRAGPHETHSLALPTYFDLAIEKEACLIVRRDTGEVFAVPDVTCKPLAE